MPKSTFKTVLGIARELGRTTTVGAIGNSGAVSITLADPTGFTSSSKVTIYDGTSTEVVTASALVGSVLTVSATVNNHTTPGLLVTTVGTASAGPTDYIPVTKFDPSDDITFLEDKGWRGSMVESYDLISGPRKGALDIGGDVFADTFGYFLGGLFGDVVFGAGTPNTHTFSVLNSSQGQPPSYQITDYYGAGTRQWGGVQFSEVGLKASGDGLLTYDAKGVSYASGTVATPTASYSTVRPTPGYAGVVTLNSAVIDKLVSFDVTMKRTVDDVMNIDGGPDPFRLWGGAVSVDGKASYVIEDDTFLNYYLSNTQPPLSIVWNIGTGATQVGLTVQMTKAAHKTAKVNRGKSYVAVEADISGLANTTDAGASAGYSPIKLVVRNTKPTGTYA
jgi:hypothetical protein